MSQPPEIMMAEAFGKAIEIFYIDSQIKGWSPLSESNEIASVEIDESWTIQIHASEEKGEEYGFPMLSVKIVYHGWPAGIIYHDGGIIAAGKAANEDTLIAALDKWLEEHRSSE